MKALTAGDLMAVAEYERGREAFRARIIELKRRRRISVGPLITLVFENRETLLFQVQEMIRVERIFDPAKVQDLLKPYDSKKMKVYPVSARVSNVNNDDPECIREVSLAQEKPPSLF